MENKTSDQLAAELEIAEERERQERYAKVGQLEYKGNSVSFIYDKMLARGVGIDKLLKKIHDLETELKEAYERKLFSRRQLETENADFRAALESIAAYDISDDYLNLCSEVTKEDTRIARTTLAKHTKKEGG
jgi:hypothetical protein